MTLFRTFVFKCELSDFKPDSPIFVNGAGNGLLLESLKILHNTVMTSEFDYIENNFSQLKFVA